ncbi:DUF2878 domain-containing protein [Ramlibacter ginsenosidimutans]|uniref:DUF2878 domain-containing protein n=1 Tax=Ramlibacter ginsenosidimutans TaxID=502333 RepID=A0A934WPR3_9BURK|nr:DUF2878 domain-containing protein [Ramlibacter ginsenosidimutans]
MNRLTLGLVRAPALRLLVNFAAFQAAWFACVHFAARGEALAACASVLAAVVLHFAWSDHRSADLRLVAVALGVGLVWDTAMVQGGLIAYAASGWSAAWAPPWILALWVLFATTLRSPLRWLHGRPLLAAGFGGIGGPLSYLAAARLGACVFPDVQVALVVLAEGWAVLTPVLVQLASRFDHEARA